MMQTCPWCGTSTEAAPCTWLPCLLAGRIERALGPLAGFLLAGALALLASALAMDWWRP